MGRAVAAEDVDADRHPETTKRLRVLSNETPPGIDLDNGTKGRPVAFENRQNATCGWCHISRMRSGRSEVRSLRGDYWRWCPLVFLGRLKWLNLIVSNLQ